MLSSLLTSIWRQITGNAAGTPLPAVANDGLPLQSAVRAAIVSLLREPHAFSNPIDYALIARFASAASSADYMVREMMSAQNLLHNERLLDFALDECLTEGLIMEFGVYRGKSLNAIAKRVRHDVHGFDSFEGLPQDWTYFQKQGRFSLRGKAPHFDAPNIRIHKGRFEQTLPRFMADNPGPARFIHIDCDIYASTNTVLQMLAPRIVSGSVLVFDEYLNCPGWQQHEFRAFQEFITQSGNRYRYIGFASSECAVAVKIL